MTFRTLLLVPLALCAAGCSSYRWSSPVPERMRTVAVPTFRNESDVTELGSVATREILREFQREGTFAIRRSDDAALEVQGVIKTAAAGGGMGDRATGMRVCAYRMRMIAEISVIDRVNGRVLVDNRKYTAETDFETRQDLLTGLRNASGRACEDLARQVVDDITALHW